MGTVPTINTTLGACEGLDVVVAMVVSPRPERAGQTEGGDNHDLAKRGRALQGVGLSSMRFHPTGGGPEDDKDGQEAWFTARIASLIG